MTLCNRVATRTFHVVHKNGSLFRKHQAEKIRYGRHHLVYQGHGTGQWTNHQGYRLLENLSIARVPDRLERDDFDLLGPGEEMK